jgi:hypothetical protein
MAQTTSSPTQTQRNVDHTGLSFVRELRRHPHGSGGHNRQHATVTRVESRRQVLQSRRSSIELAA